MANLKYTIETSLDPKGFTELIAQQERAVQSAEKALAKQPENLGFQSMLAKRKAGLAELSAAYEKLYTTIKGPTAEQTALADRLALQRIQVRDTSQPTPAAAPQAPVFVPLSGQPTLASQLFPASKPDTGVRDEGARLEAAHAAAVSAELAKQAQATVDLTGAEVEEVVVLKQAVAASQEHAKAAAAAKTVTEARTQAELADNAALKAGAVADGIKARAARQSAGAETELATAEAQEAAAAVRADAVTIRHAASRVTARRATAEQVAEVQRLVAASNAEVAALANAKTATEVQAVAARQAANAQAALNLRMASGADAFGKAGQRALAMRTALNPLLSVFPGLSNVILSLNQVMELNADKSNLASAAMKRWIGIGAVAFIGFEAVRRYREHLEELTKQIDELSEVGRELPQWAEQVRQSFVDAAVESERFERELARVGVATDKVAEAYDRHDTALQRSLELDQKLADAQRDVARARVDALLKAGQITDRQAVKLRVELDLAAFEQQLEAGEKRLQAMIQSAADRLEAESEQAEGLKPLVGAAEGRRDETRAQRLKVDEELKTAVENRAKIKKELDELDKTGDVEKQRTKRQRAGEFAYAERLAATGSKKEAERTRQQVEGGDRYQLVKTRDEKQREFETLTALIDSENGLRATSARLASAEAEAGDEVDRLKDTLKEAQKAAREWTRKLEDQQSELTAVSRSNAELFNANRKRTYAVQQGELAATGVEARREATEKGVAVAKAGAQPRQVAKFLKGAAKVSLSETETTPARFKDVAPAARAAGLGDFKDPIALLELAVAEQKLRRLRTEEAGLKPPALVPETTVAGVRFQPKPDSPLTVPAAPVRSPFAPPVYSPEPYIPPQYKAPGAQGPALNAVEKALFENAGAVQRFSATVVGELGRQREALKQLERKISTNL